jgi:hypothetical protein
VPKPSPPVDGRFVQVARKTIDGIIDGVMTRSTGDYYVLFGRGKDIIPYFARWQATQITALLEAKSEKTEHPLYGKLNIARVDALLGESVGAMLPCVTELNVTQVEGIFYEMCQTRNNTESEITAGDYHYLFGRGEDLLPCIAELRAVQVFVGKLSADQANAVIQNARQDFNETESVVEDNFIFFIGLDDSIPLTLVYLGKMTGAQRMVVFEEIHRATTEKCRSGLPYLLFMGMKLSWLIDFIDEMSRSPQELSESEESIIRQIYDFAKTVNLGSNPLLSNPKATFIRLKNFLQKQKLNSIQQELKDLYVGIAHRLMEEGDYENENFAEREVSAAESEEAVPKSERGDPTRYERIRAAYKAYFSALLVRKVTQEEVAREHGFTKETNVLSKEYIRKKFNVQKIYDEIEEYTKLYKDLRNISDKDKAKLFKMIYDTLEE